LALVKGEMEKKKYNVFIGVQKPKLVGQKLTKEHTGKWCWGSSLRKRRAGLEKEKKSGPTWGSLSIKMVGEESSFIR